VEPVEKNSRMTTEKTFHFDLRGITLVGYIRPHELRILDACFNFSPCNCNQLSVINTINSQEQFSGHLFKDTILINSSIFFLSAYCLFYWNIYIIGLFRI